jgi:predicted alpha/beta superfamily hydrolase
MIVVSAGYDPAWFSLYAKEEQPVSGRAELVLQSITDELVRFVEARYRTLLYRIFPGHSSSALFLLHGMLAAPDVMQAVLAAGPMFAEFDYTRAAAILEKSLATRPARTQFLFYTQGDQPELTRDLKAFGAWLASRQPRGLKWEFNPEPEANHSSLHVKTLYDGLRTLYADWATLPERVALGSADAVRACIIIPVCIDTSSPNHTMSAPSSMKRRLAARGKRITLSMSAWT